MHDAADGERPFIAMEYVQGTDLKEVLRKRKVNPLGLLDEFVSAGFAGTVEIPDIPQDAVDELAQDLRDRGVPVTVENIRGLYWDLGFGR